MNCLEKYRSRLIAGINRNLGIVRERAEETAVHDFRVGIKRLTALYYFLNEIEPGLKARKIVKPYRSLARAVGVIRDGHIAGHLLREMDEVSQADKAVLLPAIREKTDQDHRLFTRSDLAAAHARIRVPTLRSLGISERAMRRAKPVVLKNLLAQITTIEARMTAGQWHKKRILLKRYHHKMDAFQFCPGHAADESELKQIRILEQLLGDWHDRIITAEILRNLDGVQAAADRAIALMGKQDRLLLGSARIYLNKFGKWHQKK